jgi:hypothetical protein
MKYATLKRPPPESGSLPSVKWLAECFFGHSTNSLIPVVCIRFIAYLEYTKSVSLDGRGFHCIGKRYGCKHVHLGYAKRIGP